MYDGWLYTLNAIPGAKYVRNIQWETCVLVMMKLRKNNGTKEIEYLYQYLYQLYYYDYLNKNINMLNSY